MLDYTVDSDKLGEDTVENARKNEDLVQQLNYLIDEGFIDVEESDSGEIRLYPT